MSDRHLALDPATLDAWRAALELGEPAHSVDEAADLAGIDPDSAQRLWRGLGLPEPHVDRDYYTSEDVDALRRLSRLVEEPLEDLLQEIRVISLHLAAVAEAEVDYLLERLRAGSGHQTLVSDVLQHGFEDSDYAWLLQYALRRQLDAAVDRRLTAPAGDEAETAAVGFVDIVGFTGFVASATRHQISAVLTLLERTSIEAAATNSARVVKFIGDEVMLVASHHEAITVVAGQIAAALAAPGHAVHGGVATGTVTARGGDVVGAVVNVAHRLASAAPPRTLLERVATEGQENGGEDDIMDLPDVGRVDVRRHRLPGPPL